MTDRKQRLRVGVFGIVTVVLVAVVVVAFAGFQAWKRHDHYYVVFPDTVLGLTPGAQVFRNGIEVGSVNSVEIAPHDLSKVQVELQVAEGTPIHADTRAFLSLTGLTGVKAIDLRGGSYASPRVPEHGVIVAGVGTLEKIEARAQQLADETGKIVERANQVVDGANRVISNLDKVTDPVALQAIVDSTRRASANLDEASRGVAAMVGETRANLSRTLDSVSHAAASATTLLDTRIAGFVDSINALVSDLRGVVHGNEATLQAATADLRQAARSFKELSREVREKPSRLFFSGNQPDRKLP